MSDLEERCHIDKGTYTDGPVLTSDVRALFDRIKELEQRNTELFAEANRAELAIQDLRARLNG